MARAKAELVKLLVDRAKAHVIKPPTRKQYEVERIEMAISLCPTIYPCGKCGWPVIYGYCCHTCGDEEPNKGK